MAVDKYGYFGFEQGVEIEDADLELSIDNLKRIAELIGDEKYWTEKKLAELWNSDDENRAYSNWTAFWMNVGEFIQENADRTSTFQSRIEGYPEGEINYFSEIINEVLDICLFIEIIDADGNNIGWEYPNNIELDDFRAILDDFNHELNQNEDRSPVPDFEVEPSIDEVSFSGFIKGEPKAKWTIRNILEDVDSGKLVFPSWQRKSDAWSPAKKQNLIRSLLLKIPLPSIIIHERNDGVKEVVDGRQRISALNEFFSNKFRTAKFDSTTLLNKTAALPTEASGIEFFGNKFWEDMKNSIIRIDENKTNSIKDWMEDQLVPSLEFSGLTDEQLYYIFTVYNTNSTPLNAAEIRNAVYHDTPLHRELMREAGDLEDEHGEPIDAQNKTISKRYRMGISPKKDPTRFAATEALMRACAFTLITPKDDGKHKADSAAKAIQNTLILSNENNFDNEKSSIIADGIMKSYQTMRVSFDRVGLDPINRPSGEKQIMRYNTVRATSMHSAFILIDEYRYNGLNMSDDDFDKLVKLIDSVEQDDKQSNTKTWNYHIRVICKLIDFLSDKGMSEEDLLSIPYRDIVHAALLSKK